MKIITHCVMGYQSMEIGKISDAMQADFRKNIRKNLKYKNI
jgi:hypothetical protein